MGEDLVERVMTRLDAAVNGASVTVMFSGDESLARASINRAQARHSAMKIIALVKESLLKDGS